jgi:hypothetical protein
MRKLFLIHVLCLYSFVSALSQIDITVDCQDSWGPGRFNKVTIRIDFGEADGFARFTQDFSPGFDILPDVIPNGDFTWDNDQLNIVWMKLPSERIISFSYLIKPSQTMKGKIELDGKIILVSGGDSRETCSMKPKSILIGGTNGLQPQEIKRRETTTEATVVKDNQVLSHPDQPGRIVYRIQISTSSSEIPSADLKKRLGINPGEMLKVIKTGGVYKYQVGSFTDYDSAVLMNKQLIAKGIKDAFIVAYNGDNQIRVNKAREPAR